MSSIHWISLFFAFIGLPLVYFALKKKGVVFEKWIFVLLFISAIFLDPIYSLVKKIQADEFVFDSGFGPKVTVRNSGKGSANLTDKIEKQVLPSSKEENCANIIRNGDFLSGLSYWRGTLLEDRLELPRGFWTAPWQILATNKNQKIPVMIQPIIQTIDHSSIKITNSLPQIVRDHYGTFAQSINSVSIEGPFTFQIKYKTDEIYADNAAAFAFDPKWEDRLPLQKASGSWEIAEKEFTSLPPEVRFISDGPGTIWINEVRLIPSHCSRNNPL